MKSNEKTRNRPDDKERNDDPELRGTSGQQPEKGRMNSSGSGESNPEFTKTRQGAFNEEHPDLRTDKIFDEGEE